MALDISHLLLQPNIFKIVGDKVFIGGEEIKDDLLRTLIEEAKFIQHGRLWDILRATILDEAFHMALTHSTEWDHVLSAKMLKHYEHVITNVIHSLVAKG